MMTACLLTFSPLAALSSSSEHRSRKIHIHELDRFSHLAGVAEKARNTLALVRHPGNGFGRDRLLLPHADLRIEALPQLWSADPDPVGTIPFHLSATPPDVN
ncbi:MAG TPA: hypothetical protein VMR90_14475 [Candidatus Cybelea sp.]|nr:hypothetical protein [Candidatus Cybelea sp.]